MTIFSDVARDVEVGKVGGGAGGGVGTVAGVQGDGFSFHGGFLCL